MKIKLIIPLLLFFLILLNCSKSSLIEQTKIQETRPFYMGVTPWPADFTIAEVDTSYAFVNNHCDIVSHHFDDGIPYDEAFNNQPMPLNLQQDVQYRKSKTGLGKKILLSVSALDLTRIHKAGYFKQSTVAASIKNSWESLAFDNPNITVAYVNYISWLVNNFQPNYINFGVESNASQFNVAEFQKYKLFLSQVYSQLKVKFPTIPIFISFIVDESNEGFANASQLIAYTDYISLSAYPYVSVSSSASGNTNPELFPANYFEKFIALANKPLAISETGYIAENISIPAFNLNKQGNEVWQKSYLNLVLNLCKMHNAKFLIWFCSKDYDAAITTLQAQGLYQDLFGLWKDIGFKNQNGTKRLSYKLWDEWILKPIQ